MNYKEEKVKVIYSEISRDDLERHIHNLISKGYQDFNIRIIKQDRSDFGTTCGNTTYGIKVFEDRDKLLERGRKEYPQLNIS